MFHSMNPWAQQPQQRNAGAGFYTPPKGATSIAQPSRFGYTPPKDAPTPAQCLAGFNAFYSANASEYANRGAALAAFAAAMPTCSVWANAQLALEPVPSGPLSDGQCSNLWDAWRVTPTGAAYSDANAALVAFGRLYPGCQSWATRAAIVPASSATACSDSYAAWRVSAEGASVVGEAAALSKFATVSPACQSWTVARIAALGPSDADCANAWALFHDANVGRYPDVPSMMYAFASGSPACQAWVTAQVAAARSSLSPITYEIVQPLAPASVLGRLGMTCAQWNAQTPTQKLALLVPIVGTPTDGTTPAAAAAALAPQIDASCPVVAAPPASSSATSPMMVIGGLILAGLALTGGKLKL